MSREKAPKQPTPRTDEVTPWQGDFRDGPLCCYCGFARCDAGDACACLDAEPDDLRKDRK